MKKSLTKLFLLRFFFYFSVIILIFLHPGIKVNFDRIGIMQWFVIIPLMAVLAFIPDKRIKMRTRQITALVTLSLLSLIAAGVSIGVFVPFAAGLICFALTYLLFQRTQQYSRWARIAAIEPFFFAWVCLRLLSLSRSGEEIAGQSMALTQFILVWTAVVFLFHNIVIYLCLFPKSREKAWKEGLVFALGAFAVLVVLLVVLPPDFVRNAVIQNLVSERIPERIRPSDSDRDLPRRGEGRRTLPRGERGQQGELRGVSEHDWPGRGGGSGESRQYMVKIVVSAREPVYMGESFRGQLDPVHGFLLSAIEPANELTRQRFFVTWTSGEREFDRNRRRHEVFSLSTMQQKYLPYRPVVIDPTILSEDTGPLRYIHQTVSNTHLGDPLLLVNTPTRPFTEREKNMLAHYLEIQLEENDRIEFEKYLDDALRMWHNNREEYIKSDEYLKLIFAEEDEWFFGHGYNRNEYMENIIALLVSFSRYQYNLTQSNDHSIDEIKHFLFDTMEGDCVVFSNSLALLGRLAGIPSRVVTGYLAAENLQTPAHLRGLSVLRGKIPVLQQFPFGHLFMVTNLHGHSWTQFYIPDYGWLDFESTAFSIPPQGMGDFNNWDVIIPIIDDNRTFSQIRKFPWRAVGRAVLALAVFAVIGAYTLRYGRELILYIGTRRGGRAGARSLYLLLLARLAADGKPIKPASKTAHEYNELFAKSLTRRHNIPSECINKEEELPFKAFADIYSEIRWRQFANPVEEDERFQMLKHEYHNILNSTRRKGLHRSIIRIISLRGLAYL